jgi:hypothetical protein
MAGIAAAWALGTVPAGTTAAGHGPTTLPPAARGPVSAALGRHEAGFRVVGLRARNPGQRLGVTFSRAGATVASGSARAHLGLVGYGRASAVRPVGPATPRVDVNRVRYARGAVDEWYANGPLGLEQGFDVRARPEAGSGPVTFVLAPGDGLHVRRDGPSGVVLRGGGASLRYGGLTTTDARGRVLRSWLATRPGHLALKVDDRGAAYPIRVDPLVQQAELTANDGAAGDVLGASVAISGDTIAALAPVHSNGAGATRGAVYVFVKPASGWANATQTAKLTSSRGTADETLSSVAISGDTVVAGSPGHTVGSTANQGAVYVFQQPAGGWRDTHESATLTTSDGQTDDSLGAAVGISGDTVVGSAPHHAVLQRRDQGAAYVFVKPASGWKDATQTAELTVIDGAAEDSLSAVAISGDTVAAGVDRHPTAGNVNQGIAYLFAKPAGGWTDEFATSELTASDGAAGDQFGLSVAVDGDTVVVGAPSHQVGLAHQGAAYVFSRPFGGFGPKTTQTAQLTAADGSNNDNFGFSVAVSGPDIAVGSPLHQVGNNGDQGAGYVFTKPGALWKNTNTADELTADDGAAGDLFGLPIGISNGIPVAAAGLHSVGARASQGALYVFGPAPPPPAPPSGSNGGGGATPSGAAPTPPPDGTQTPSSGGATPPPGATPPALTQVRESARVWRAGGRLAAVAASRRAVGTTFSFALDQPAAVSLRFAHKVAAHRGRHRMRTAPAGTVRLTGHPGANRIRFEGRISRSRKLKPGRYTVQVEATNAAGQRTVARSLTFTIVH